VKDRESVIQVRRIGLRLFQDSRNHLEQWVLQVANSAGMPAEGEHRPLLPEQGSNQMPSYEP
jgi:hypothetical protein